MASKPKQPYIDTAIEAIAESEEISIEEARDQYLERSDHVLKLDDLQPQNHHWVDRGLVMSCEGGTHPSHRAFKRM